MASEPQNPTAENTEPVHPASIVELTGTKVWFVTDGTADALGWQDAFVLALERLGAHVTVLGVPGMLGLTARGLIGQGAERIARTLRFSRRGAPDVGAFESLQAARPDLIVADNSAVLRTLEVLRDASRSSAVHVALVGAFTPLEGWAGASADAFVSPDPGLLATVRTTTHADAAIQQAGPPVAPGFNKLIPQEEARASLALDGRVVLLDVTNMSAESIARTVASCRTASQMTLMFYYGSDGSAAEALRRSAARHGVQAHMFGHVDDLERFAAAADVVVVGPDNRMAAAYLAIDRPIIALEPALATTSAAREQAIVVLRDDVQLGAMLAQVQEEGVSQAWIDAARDAVEVDPTTAAAKAIAKIWGAKDDLKTRQVVPAAQSVQSAVKAGENQAPGARLEAIGTTPLQAPVLAPMTRDEAKRRLAELIVDERRIEGQVGEAAKERDVWYERLALAEDEGAVDLIDFANVRTRELTARISSLNDEAGRVRDQKEEVRKRALAGLAKATAPAAPTATAPTTTAKEAESYEERFRRLERDKQLDRLRQRAFDDE